MSYRSFVLSSRQHATPDHTGDVPSRDANRSTSTILKRPCQRGRGPYKNFPVHVLAINAMGLHLLDWLRFDDLAAVCEELNRWSFLCVIAPLRLGAGTGSPVNPIAIF